MRDISAERAGVLWRGSEAAGEYIPHSLFCLALSGAGHMDFGVQSESGGGVPQHTGDGFGVHPILQGQL